MTKIAIKAQVFTFLLLLFSLDIFIHWLYWETLETFSFVVFDKFTKELKEREKAEMNDMKIETASKGGGGREKWVRMRTRENEKG